MATQLKSLGLSEQYASASPFPHIVLDDFFEPDRAAAAAAEIKERTVDMSAEFYGQHLKGGQRDLSKMGPVTASLIREMGAPGFIAWLQDLTGIGGLRADPDLFGGGVHQIRRGGFLKVHADFNWHATMQLYRRVNVLLYLNPGWQKEWGGNLELWHTDMSGPGASIQPLLGRLAVFSTTDDSFHGHPDPLNCPAEVTRNSIALYYYSSTPAPGAQRSEMTNYQPRHGERFGARHLLHRLKLWVRA
ncbi:2OG-Fe(II) oxygenase [uncultured Sphingomonas sp.]|uniref:2OG-Fe(II) oxygenase n=1 Tax=uncultured Sphingomonas sp. TaxID=158754 RepID=UPI0025E49C00|nr:2OG-Fe(II) oxygenase [uncultured Sphingomonas sp.]